MTSNWDEIKQKLSALASSWASYAALGTFLLYLFGYLSLRFHLTALGIPTDLNVVDGRYFYAGAKFLVYIALYVPLVLFAVIVLFLPLSMVVALIYRRLRQPSNTPEDASRDQTVFQKLKLLSQKPWFVASAGILVSEVWIQFLMRQCLVINDALLNPAIVDTTWVGSIMKNTTTSGKLREVIFFSVMVLGTVVAGWLLARAWRLRKAIATERLLKAQKMNGLGTCILLVLLAVLFSIQVLLLPVNHGVLIADKVLPRVKDLGGQEKLDETQSAWLVWEGTDTVTYLVHGEPKWNVRDNRWESRTLVTLPRKDIKRTEVLANDSIETLLNEP